MSRKPTWRSWTLAHIWHSDLHLAACGKNGHAEWIAPQGAARQQD
jgi:hypothetical protein